MSRTQPALNAEKGNTMTILKTALVALALLTTVSAQAAEQALPAGGKANMCTVFEVLGNHSGKDVLVCYVGKAQKPVMHAAGTFVVIEIDLADGASQELAIWYSTPKAAK